MPSMFISVTCDFKTICMLLYIFYLFQMFFINRGTVEVVSEDGNVVFATMDEGKFFGEISLVFSVPRTASIRYITF